MAILLPEFSHAPIDIHSHFDHGASAEPPQKPIHIMDLEHIKAGYDRFGIYYAGMSTYASVMFCPECIVEENEYLHNLVQKTDWMYQWVVMDPRQPETYRQAEQMLQNPKVLGEIEALFAGQAIEVEFVSHSELKILTCDCRAVIRTGETTPYANIILQSGCIFA